MWDTIIPSNGEYKYDTFQRYNADSTSCHGIDRVGYLLNVTCVTRGSIDVVLPADPTFSPHYDCSHILACLMCPKGAGSSLSTGHIGMFFIDTICTTNLCRRCNVLVAILPAKVLPVKKFLFLKYLYPQKFCLPEINHYRYMSSFL